MSHQWYIIRTSGSENNTKKAILERAAKKNLTHHFEEIVIPGIQVVEVKRGKPISVNKKTMPGYILVKMDMTSEIEDLISGVAKLSRFPGSESKIKAISEKEVQEMLVRLEDKTQAASLLDSYEVGEEVRVMDGPFETFIGRIEEVDYAKRMLKLSIGIFQRSTELTVSFSQVEKVNEN